MVVAINLHYQILSSITTDDVTELLRELLKKHIFEEQLPDYYKTIIKPRASFVKTEEQLVLASPTEGYDKFDLSLLIKVLRNLCGAEVNKNLESLYRIRNAISHLPSTNINQQDFNRWFNELCTLAEEIEKKLEKPSRVRHLFCSFRDKVIAESIENHIALAEQDLETLASKGEDISNHELGKHLCQFQSYIQNIENKIHGRLRRLKKYAHQVGKTVRPPDDAYTFIRSSGWDRTNLTNTSAHKPHQTSQLNHRKTQFTEHILLGQNIGQLTQTTESTSYECIDAERRQIPTKNTEEHLHCRMSYQGVEKEDQLHCLNRSHTCTANQTKRLYKPLLDSLHNCQLKPDLNQTSSSLQRNIKANKNTVNNGNNKRQDDTCASLDSPNNPPIPLCHSITPRTIDKTSVNPTVEHMNDNPEARLCVDHVTKCTPAKIDRYKEREKWQINKNNSRDEAKAAITKRNEQWEEDSSKNQKDSSKRNKTELSFEKMTTVKKKPRLSKKKTDKYEGTPSSHTSPFVTIPGVSRLSGSVINDDMNRPENNVDLQQKTSLSYTKPQFYYPLRLLNVNGVTGGRTLYSDRISYLFKCLMPTSWRDVALQGKEVKRKPRTCYESFGVDFRGDDTLLVTDDQDDYNLATPDYDGDVVILHSDHEFPQDRDLADKVLTDLKNTFSLTGDLQEAVQIPGTRVFDVRRFFHYKKIFVLVTRYYKQSPILQYIVDIILLMSLKNKNVKDILIPVLMENTSYPCEFSPIHPLEFFKTFEDGGMEHYYQNTLQKLFPHRILRRSVSCL